MREMDAPRTRGPRLAPSAPAPRGHRSRHGGCQSLAGREARRGGDSSGATARSWEIATPPSPGGRVPARC